MSPSAFFSPHHRFSQLIRHLNRRWERLLPFAVESEVKSDLPRSKSPPSLLNLLPFFFHNQPARSWKHQRQFHLRVIYADWADEDVKCRFVWSFYLHSYVVQRVHWSTSWSWLVFGVRLLWTSLKPTWTFKWKRNLGLRREKIYVCDPPLNLNLHPSFSFSLWRWKSVHVVGDWSSHSFALQVRHRCVSGWDGEIQTFHRLTSSWTPTSDSRVVSIPASTVFPSGSCSPTYG